MKPLYVKAGDTFFTHSNTLLGKLIRFGETDKGEAKGSTWANHMGVIIQSGWIGSSDPLAVPAVVIEALWKTRRGPLNVNDAEVRVFRPVPEYDQFELERFTQEAESYVGDTYGWYKLLVQLADRVAFGGRKVFTTAMFLKSRPICSFLAGFVNQMAQSGTRTGARVKEHIDRGDNGKAVYTFGVPPQALDPDTAMDYCLKNPEEWLEVL